LWLVEWLKDIKKMEKKRKNLKDIKKESWQKLQRDLAKEKYKQLKLFLGNNKIKKILTPQLKDLIKENPVLIECLGDPTLCFEAKEQFLLYLKRQYGLSTEETNRLIDLSIIVSQKPNDEFDDMLEKLHLNFPYSEDSLKNWILPKIKEAKLNLNVSLTGLEQYIYLTFPGKTDISDRIIKLDIFNPTKHFFEAEPCHWRKHYWIPLKGDFEDKICAVCGKVSLFEDRLKKHPERTVKKILFSQINIKDKEGKTIPIEEYFGDDGEETKRIISQSIVSYFIKDFSEIQKQIIELKMANQTSKEIAQIINKEKGVNLTPDNVRKISQRLKEKLKGKY
jgi:hypothetical protein